MDHTNYTDNEYTFSGAAHTQSINYILTQRDTVLNQTQMHPSMSPKNTVRESRGDNPSSVYIFFDVTGSMGTIPEKVTTDTSGLARLFDALPGVLPNPQLAFGAIGDSSGRCSVRQRHSTFAIDNHNRFSADEAPLQCGRFEPNNRCADDLAHIWREGGGNGNDGESYHLAWIFALRQIILDSWADGKKGILITVGDEIPHPEIRSDEIKDRLDCNYDGPSICNEELLWRIKERFVVFHICIDTDTARAQGAFAKWQTLLGEDYVVNLPNIPETIADQISTAILDTIIPIAKDNWSMPLLSRDLLAWSAENNTPWHPIPRQLRMLELLLNEELGPFLEGTDVSLVEPLLLDNARTLLDFIQNNPHLTHQELMEQACEHSYISTRIQPIVEKMNFRNLSQTIRELEQIITNLSTYQALYHAQSHPALARLLDKALEKPITQALPTHWDDENFAALLTEVNAALEDNACDGDTLTQRY